MIVDRIEKYLSDPARTAPASLAEEVGRRAAAATARQFCEPPREFQPGGWKRLSNSGKCPRRLYYQATGVEAEPLQPRTRMIFWFGDVLEQAVLGLAKAAGCDISCEQEEVRVAGIPGHIDAKIRVPRPPWDDGSPAASLMYVVEIKTMSDYGYEEFVARGLDDLWGYVSQAKAYAYATCASGTVVLGVKKSTGHMHEQVIEATEKDRDALVERFGRVEHALEGGMGPPARPYKPEAIVVRKTITAEEKLPVVCGYCPYTKPCWEPEGFAIGFHNGKPIWKRDARAGGSNAA